MNIIGQYVKTYEGLSAPAWMLALVLLINRTGTMVLPFLSIYLSKEMSLETGEVGIVLSLFGAGSLVGAYLGGFLIDKIGAFHVQLWSLILTGVGFYFLEMQDSFYSLSIGFFIITVISDTFRPANAASVAQYARPENLTRAYSLNRMAINLGFALGPIAGGVLAMYGYKWLFYMDGMTCILAGLVFFLYFSGRAKADAKKPIEIQKKQSPIRDGRYVLFSILTILFGTVFFQFFFTLPLYYREIYKLSERSIGALLGINGGVVFLLEMPLVYILSKAMRLGRAVAIGGWLLGLSFLALNLDTSLLILIIAMILLSIAEIFVMPFLLTYAANRPPANSRGAYLGFHSMSYSVSFILAPAVGFYLVNHNGYPVLWYGALIASLLVGLGFYFTIGKADAAPTIIKVLERID